MSKEYETTITKEIEMEESQAAEPNGGEAATPEESEAAVLKGGVVTVKGREFYCTFPDGKKQMKCISIKGEVQLRPPENSWFYSVAIEQLTNGSEG